MNYFPTSNRTIMKSNFTKIDNTALLKKIHKNKFVKGEKNRQNTETCDRDSMQNDILNFGQSERYDQHQSETCNAS
ncbi:hypothetical protein T07_602 [Trichinella nelsoni]|uniref:Uncharacterized protein n=1 Tax=Trichinella nelsoni TaxID=6336 RepID=A0A0V0SKG3_9BILA|nr:hypothetical protein T07_602 [Trichinella nelsoni]